MIYTIDRQSLEYLPIRISGKKSGEPYDPTGDTVAIGLFTGQTGTDIVGDWITAEWETIGSNHYAKALIGPGGTVVAPGSYFIRVKVTDSPETPVIPAGQLYIT